MKDQSARNVGERNLPTSIDKSRSPKRCKRLRATWAACILCGYDGTDVLYYRFPPNETKNEWLRLCELPEGTKTRNLRLCGRHFAENDIWFAANGSAHLKHGVLPKLNLEIYGLNNNKSESSVLAVQQSRNCTENEPVLVTSSVPYYAESTTDDNLERNFNLKNTSNIELVEVVEMKIYRCNSLPTAGTSESFSVMPSNTEPYCPTSVDDFEDNPDAPSIIATHVKGLEMHSYSKPASTEIPVMTNKESQNIKRVKALRYFGDLQEQDFANPDTAKHCWGVAKRLIDKRNEKILLYQEENEKLERKLKNLKEILRQLRMTGSIPLKFRKVNK